MVPQPVAAGRRETPGWFWTAAGCLTVLAVGFPALFWIFGGSSRGDNSTGSAIAKHSGGSEAYIQVESLAAPVAPVVPAAPPVHAEAKRAPGHQRASSPSLALGQGMRVPPAPAAAAAPAPAAKDDDTGDDSAPAPAAAPAAAAAPETAKQAAARAAIDDDADDSPAKTEATAAAAPAPAREQATDDETPTMSDRHNDPAANRATVEAALNALTPKVRRCYFKFQIPGSAQVKLVATPSGSIESVAVAGDFEGTPTGDCVAAELAAATLPSFKGGSLRLNHTFVLR